MWKPSKKVLFVLMLASGVTGGISLSLVDWSTLKNGKDIIQELQLPLILLILSFAFMLKYLKRLKSNI